jgi:TolA-binding protein
VGQIEGKSPRGFVVVGMLLVSLVCFAGDRVAASGENAKGPAMIRVEDGRDFTRVVFPCHPSEESSIEPDLARGRFIVRFPNKAPKIAPPSLVENHHLIKKIKILPNTTKGLEIEILLVNDRVDWVSYGYERPPRMVLYLKPRAESTHPRDMSSPLPSPQKTEIGKTTTPASTPKTDDRAPSEKNEKPTVLATTPESHSDQSVLEALWRQSAKDIPEFIRLGAVYPPDFHEMEAKERRLYQEALERFRKRDFTGAREIAQKIVPEDPFSSVAETIAFFKADCAFHVGEEEGDKAYLRAIGSYQEAVTQFSGSRFVPNAILVMAMGYRRIRFFQEALVQYQQFLTRFPKDPAASEALFWQGECLFQSGKYGEAKRLFGEFADRFPRSVHGRIAALRVGDCLYKMGDMKGAHQQYGVALSESSDLSFYPADSLFHAGLAFLRHRDYQRGREILFKAVNLDPGCGEAGEMMDAVVESYLMEGRDEEALRANLMVWGNLEKEDTQGIGRVRLADMRLRHPSLRWPPVCVDAYLEPIGVYDDFLETCQDMDLADEVMYRKSLALVKRGEVQQAVATLKRILSQRRRDGLRRRSSSLLTYCLNALIQSLQGRGDHLGVARLYKENGDFLLSSDYKDRRGLLLVGESFQHLGLLDEALAVYRHIKADANVPRDHVFYQIGHLLSLKGDREAARKALGSFREAFPKSPYLPRVERLLGDLSFEMKDYRAAVTWYRRSVDSNTGDPKAGRIYARLGRALKRSDQHKEAMEAYQEAMGRLWPFREQTWSREILEESLSELAVYYDDQGRISEALKCYERIVRLSPSEDKVNWALYRLGHSYRRLGNTEMMTQVFEDLSKRSAGSLWAKLATWTEGDAAFEGEVGPYLAEIQEALVEARTE